MRLVLYTVDCCEKCKEIEKEMKSRGLVFTTIKVTDSDIKHLTNMRVFPTLVFSIGGTNMVFEGYDDIIKFLDDLVFDK